MRPVNLLPGDLAKKAAARRRLLGLVATGVVYAVLLVLVVIWWNGKLADAEAELARQEEVNAATSSKIAALKDAQDLRTAYETDVGLVQAALARDVAWGRLLNDLARVIPERVWLNGFTGSTVDDPDAPEIYGQVQMSGTAFDYPDVSTWLRVLDEDPWPSVGGGWVTSATLSSIGDVPVIEFNSAASLTGASLSERAADRIPEVPE